MAKKFYKIFDKETDTIYLGLGNGALTGTITLKDHSSMSGETFNLVKYCSNGQTPMEIAKDVWKNTPEKNKSDHPLNLDGLVVSTLDLKE